MDNKFIINDNDYIFKIIGKEKERPTETIVFGDENNRLEINTYNGSNQIYSIDCIYLENLSEEKYFLPDYTQIEGIKEFHDISCYYDEDSFRDFELNLSSNQLDILLNENLDAVYYYADGRIEYYYDDNMLLLYVKVKNLTPEEYNYFKNLRTSINITK